MAAGARHGPRRAGSGHAARAARPGRDRGAGGRRPGVAERRRPQYPDELAGWDLVPPVLEIHWSTPLYHDGYLYAFSGRNEPDARFRCVELKTGRLMWDREESWPAHSTPQPKVYGRGSMIMADGKLIALGEGGLLGLFKPNMNRADELARFQVPQLQHPCWAAPVLANKRLFLRSEDQLVCLNLAR